MPEPTADANAQSPHPAGVRRWFDLALGFVFLGIGVVGAILPVLPTTPWVLLSAGCFARSSPRMHRWLKRSPYFGPMIRDWEKHRGIRWRVKLFAVAMVVTVISLTVIFRDPPDWAKASIIALGLVGIATILFVVPTVWDFQLRSTDEPDA